MIRPRVRMLFLFSKVHGSGREPKVSLLDMLPEEDAGL